MMMRRRRRRRSHDAVSLPGVGSTEGPRAGAKYFLPSPHDGHPENIPSPSGAGGPTVPRRLRPAPSSAWAGSGAGKSGFAGSAWGILEIRGWQLPQRCILGRTLDLDWQLQLPTATKSLGSPRSGASGLS